MKKVYVETPYKAACYQDLVVPLAAQGRHDLVRGIQRIIARGEAEWWKRIPKQFDRKFLNGNLLKLHQAVVQKEHALPTAKQNGGSAYQAISPQILPRKSKHQINRLTQLRK
jgi:hypothetical protein